MLAQILLEEQSKKHGYEQSRIKLGFWKHKGRPICFTLVVYDFEVKYIRKEHARHLISVLKGNHEILEYWKVKKYVGLNFDWDYEKNGSMCPCPGMYTTPSYSSSMAHHGDIRIIPNNTQCKRMVLGKDGTALLDK